MTNYYYSWLTLRLMKKQRLRTAALFCGILFSGILLHAFWELGYYFWSQVHTGSSKTAVYDSTQQILIALAALLAGIVMICAAVFIHNLFSLTMVQKSPDLIRLISLGASPDDILYMTCMEACILAAAAIPFCHVFIYAAAWFTKTDPTFPFQLRIAVDIWLFMLTCRSALSSIPRNIRRPSHRYSAAPAPAQSVRKKTGLHKHPRAISPMTRCRKARLHRYSARCGPSGKSGNGKHLKHPLPFAVYMSRQYHKSCRKRHRRITITLAAAVILYVPAGYLIRTNLQIDQEGLHQTYGIEYLCTAVDSQTLADAISECSSLIQAEPSIESVFYVKTDGEAFIPSRLLDDALLTVLKKAGWQKQEQLHTGSDIYFLEDNYFQTYLCSCLALQTDDPADKTQKNPDGCPPAILVNRYINRTSYAENTAAFFGETPLLNKDAQQTLNGSSCPAGPGSTGNSRGASRTYKNDPGGNTNMINMINMIRIYQGTADSEKNANARLFIRPAFCCDKLPDGIDAGNITVILPLSQLSAYIGDKKDPTEDSSCAEVRGVFADTKETDHDVLSRHLPEDAKGRLVDLRKNYRRWYDSLRSIHLAMRCICGLLFATALLNAFCTMLFHCIQRRHGFAILWSYGSTRKSLSAILILECLYGLIHALAAAVPLSCFLCYIIYRIYRPAWRLPFAPPYTQLLAVSAFMALAAAAAVAVSQYLLKRQDFLKELRRIL